MYSDMEERIKRRLALSKPVSFIRQRQYADTITEYFQACFPQRRTEVLTGGEQHGSSISVQVLYPLPQEPFYVVHTVRLLAATASTPACELWLLLPSTWPFQQASLIHLQEPAAWPLRLLGKLGEQVRAHRISLANGVSVPYCQAPEGAAGERAPAGVIMAQISGDLAAVKEKNHIVAELFMPVLVYKEEWELMKDMGTDALLESVIACNQGSFQLQLHRPNVADMEFILQ